MAAFRRVLVAILALGVLATLTTGCEKAVAGTRCKGNGVAQDATWVLRCQNGRWTKWFTKEQGLKTFEMLKAISAQNQAPAPAPAPAAAQPAGWEAEMLGAVNFHRAANGVAPLVACGNLNEAAQAHSQDQADHSSMSHNGSDGSTVGERAGRAGYAGWYRLGENVAYGYPDIASVMAGWMGSSGHKANILDGRFTHLGVGRARSGTGPWYWTQVFGAAGSC